MVERRPLIGLVFALMLCVSLWQVSVQQAQFVPDYAAAPIDADIPAAAAAASVPKGNQLNDPLDNAITYPPAITLDQLSADDPQQLIDLTNFQYLIAQPSCSPAVVRNQSGHLATPSPPAPHTLILVHSAPRNWNKRNVVRETWGRDDPRARLFFLLGAVESRQLQHKLERENYLYGDLIQGNFQDAYRNMTYKHVMGLKWLAYNCPAVKYLLKTDDDVFVHAPNVYDFLHEPTTLRRELLFCDRLDNVRVSRSYRSKWRVSTKEYAGHTYPPYCPGYSIIYSADTAFALYRAAQRTPYFWIDDVHVTGTLAAAANVTISPLGASFLSRPEMSALLEGGREPAFDYFLFTVPNLTEEKIRAIWRHVAPRAPSRTLNATTTSSPDALSAAPNLDNR